MDTVDLGGVSQGVRHADDGGAAVEAPRVGAFGRWLGECLQHGILDAAGVRLELWDGSSPYRGTDPPVGDMVVRDQRTLLHIVLDPDLAFGEGYMSGQVAIRGSLDRVIEALTRTAAGGLSWRDRLRTLFGRSSSLGDARRNVHHHYDLGNDFYRRWLDREMVYTCAYFPSPDATLEQAQVAKLDLVCRKLNLRAGEEVVEAGCGWGALALHMARRYGVRVKAYNVSREQLAFARERARRG